ncbi:MAG TPA: bifunctional diaminohydroxyphosphoribosylaminopyrimidine deaminase/5-amino-6-(5-phosphoribosylamino)uracil reductase RibD [Candidatus Aquilonibacter sp.]|nr:bifunctional diaminohydroxyphosphoribosylaminopyrimidine deaminase/5-amino-6-(5-phosphoribosylamino)uracil reductase RibD [Candidatus Aquilonibacter sp.]
MKAYLCQVHNPDFFASNPLSLFPPAATMPAMSDAQFMRLALRLARRGRGTTSPNPMVGAILVKGGKIIGRGWHRRAGLPHAEIEALRDAQKRGHRPKGATLFVTLEPCSTHGRTPPCTEAIISAGIKKVVAGATDPNPKHSGRGFRILHRAGIEAVHGVLVGECARLNEAFNYWIVHRTPFVTVKAAMTLDGKIATVSGESKWITGEKSRAVGMELRRNSDAILVGINTILADNPSLTARGPNKNPRLRRTILDSLARTPPDAKVVSDEFAALTTIVVSSAAPKNRVAALAKRVNVLLAPTVNSKFEIRNSKLDLRWLLKKLGAENITSLLVEGGGEVNASFLLGGFAQRVAFFYAPKILGGRDARKAVAGDGAKRLADAIQLDDVEWEKIGEDLFMTALVARQRKT